MAYMFVQVSTRYIGMYSKRNKRIWKTTNKVETDVQNKVITYKMERKLIKKLTINNSIENWLVILISIKYKYDNKKPTDLDNTKTTEELEK